jgi:hypothetical protein
MHPATATRAPVARLAGQLLARRPTPKDRADLIIERCAEDAACNTATECGMLRGEVRKLVAEIGDSDIPRDPCLTYAEVEVAGTWLILGWQWRYRCVEVIEVWHGGDNIAELLGDRKVADLADRVVL